MEHDFTNKRNHVLIRGRGVTAAQQTFNLHGVGSIPSDPTRRWRVAQRLEQRPYKTQVEGSTPSAPIDGVKKQAGLRC